MQEILLSDIYQSIQETGKRNVATVLEAFHLVKLSESDLIGTTGYGYGDIGREKLEKVYAYIFGGEDAIVRPQITSGTHAIYLAMRGLASAHTRFLFWGDPYDTVRKLLVGDNRHSLKKNIYQVKITENPSEEDIKGADIIMLQRSGGYKFIPGLNISSLSQRIDYIKKINAGAIILVDNCYGEFVEDKEPLHVGADVIVGSLIKNPGGTLAHTGGYIIGKKFLIEEIADFAFSPALGKEVGATRDFLGRAYQGLFFAPSMVAESLWSKTFILDKLNTLDIDVLKESYPYSDIIVRIRLNSESFMLDFARIVQSMGPVNSHFLPIPESLPGYDKEVIMASPTFVTGATLELSADGVVEKPFEIYLQPGISRYHTMVYIDKLVEVLKREKSS